MKVSKVIKKFEARLGAGCVSVPGDRGRYTVRHNGYVASWINNGPGGLDAEACNFHLRSENDHTDLHTDYFAGSFRDNASQLLNALCPPPNKFSVGVLVEAKQNKRATRQGYAGKVGLVRELSGSDYVKLQWVGEDYPAGTYGYANSFPTRDLQLVSGVS